jgi:hypothetical protein
MGLGGLVGRGGYGVMAAIAVVGWWCALGGEVVAMFVDFFG